MDHTPWHRAVMARVPRWLHRMVLRFEAAITDGVEAFARSLPPRARVLDAGAGEGQYRSHFEGCRYVGLDLAVGDAEWDYGGLDVLGDLHRLPFPDASFDAALSVVVLEHVKEPARALAEIGRVLRPGGRLLLIVPQEWGVHQVPNDYFRYTSYGLRWMLGEAGLEPERIDPVGGFFTLLGRRCLDSAVYFTGGWRWLALPLVALLAGPPGLLLPYLDGLDEEKLSTLGYVCVARRRPA